MGGIAKPFDECYTPEPNTGCWLWNRALYKDGYGVRKEGGKALRAHRVSWEKHFGEDPGDLYVLHKCDTPSCVNPDHLFLGTPQDNSSDMTRKDRQRKGEDMPLAKLTAPKVRAIRALYEFGHGWSSRKLAREFGVSRVAIKYIYQRKTWTHV